MAALPSVDQALATMLAGVATLPAERASLTESDGRWLARDVVATRDQPPFDASVMDGWALRQADAAPGAMVRIVGESAAGRSATVAVEPGQAVRIFTGARLPDGADRVVMQEEAERVGDHVRLGSVGASRFVRPRGCDFRQGETLLAAGTRLDPWRLALAASAGLGEATCAARPRVAVLATGDELADPGAALSADRIFDSAGVAVAAVIQRLSGWADRRPRAGDDEAAIAAAIEAARFDLLLVIGGASVGDHDRVKPAVRRLGAVLTVEGAMLQPGKPVWFGTFPDGRPVLGLPGNPASALVCSELFLAPILARMQGGKFAPKFGRAVLESDLPANGPRERYLRALAGVDADGSATVRPFAEQDSSLVSVLAASNVLIVQPPGSPALAAGARVVTRDPAT